METNKSFGPTKVTVWSCWNCIYLDNKIHSPNFFCRKVKKVLDYTDETYHPIIITSLDICPYLKNENTSP